MKRRWATVRRTAKVVCLCCSVLVLVGWSFSLLWSVDFVARADFLTGNELRQWGIADGVLWYGAWHPVSIEEYVSLGWHAGRSRGGLGLRMPVVHLREFRWYADLPFWGLFVFAAFPTTLLWWFDRRRFPPGHCQNCGYNLTGNVSGICPECGTPVKREDKPA
jgi:hypothetical protein